MVNFGEVATKVSIIGVTIAPGQDLAYVVAQTIKQISTETDYELFRVRLSDGQVGKILSASETQTGSISSIALSASGKTLIFSGSRVTEFTCESGDETCERGVYSSVGYELTLGKFADAANAEPSTSSTSLKIYNENLEAQVESGVPCFDVSGAPSVCAPPVSMESASFRANATLMMQRPTFRFPLTAPHFISRGFNAGPTHVGRDRYAIDWNLPAATDCGNNVVAAADGVVRLTGFDGKGYGRYVVIGHGSTYTLYGHMINNSLRVQIGDQVTRGSVIGLLGTTGNSDNCHLHFVVRTGPIDIYAGQAFDPRPLEGIGPSNLNDITIAGGDCPINAIKVSSGGGWSSKYYYNFTECGEDPKAPKLEINPASVVSLLAYAPTDANPSGQGNTVATAPFTVRNTGKAKLYYRAELTDTGNVSFAQLALGGPVSGTLDATQSVNNPTSVGLRVDLQCNSFGSADAVINITSNGGNQSLKVSVNCQGPKLTGPSPSAVLFSLSPVQSDTRSFSVFNAGNLDLAYTITKSPVPGLYSTLTYTAGNGIIPRQTGSTPGEQKFNLTATCTTGSSGSDGYQITVTNANRSTERITIPVTVTCQATPATLSGPAPTTLAFDTTVGFTSKLPFRIRNTGSPPMTFARGLVNNDPGVAQITWDTQLVTVLGAYQELELIVSVQCLTKGTTAGRANIDAGSAGAGNVALTITCRAPVLALPPSGPLLSAKAGEASAPGTVRISNTGDAPLLYRLGLSGSSSLGQLTLNPTISTDLTLAPGAAQDVTVTLICAANRFGSESLDLVVTSQNGGGSGAVTIPFTCKLPKFGLAPAALNFSLENGAQESKPFDLTNVGNFDLAYITPLTVDSSRSTVSSLTVTSGTGVITSPVIVDSTKGKQTFVTTAKCTGFSATPDVHTITVARADKPTDTVQVQVNVTCTPKPAKLTGPNPVSLQFDGVVETPLKQGFSIDNTGEATMTYQPGTPTINDPSIATAKYVEAVPGSGVVVGNGQLGGGARFNFALEVTCLKAGNTSGSLTISAGGAGSGSLGFSITCKGAQIAVSPGALTLSTTVDTNAVAQLTVSNPGVAPLRVTTVTANQTWLSAAPTALTVAPGATQTITVTAACASTPTNGSPLAATLEISSNAGAGPMQVPVTLECAPGVVLLANDAFHLAGGSPAWSGETSNTLVVRNLANTPFKFSRVVTSGGYGLTAVTSLAGSITALGSYALTVRLNCPQDTYRFDAPFEIQFFQGASNTPAYSAQGTLHCIPPPIAASFTIRDLCGSAVCYTSWWSVSDANRNGHGPTNSGEQKGWGTTGVPYADVLQYVKDSIQTALTAANIDADVNSTVYCPNAVDACILEKWSTAKTQLPLEWRLPWQ